MDEQTKNQILFDGANAGNLIVVNDIIKKGADVNARGDDGGTALMLASQDGHTDVAKLLIEKGADVNARKNDGVTILILASQDGHTDVAKLLIEKGADVNARSNKGGTALILASKGGHIDVAKLLIEKGADVNARDDDGLTALMFASHKGNTDMVSLLRNAGARSEETKPGEEKRSGCFIATAVYGNENAPEVEALRHFRDNFLARTYIGRAFIAIYYLASPPIARLIKTLEISKKLVKAILLKPALWVSQQTCGKQGKEIKNG
jgi:ankyrin repeat protein